MGKNQMKERIMKSQGAKRKPMFWHTEIEERQE